MRRRQGKDGPPEIPEHYRPDYQRASESLRQTNFDAAQLVIALVRMHEDAEQCRCLCQKLRATVLLMKLFVEACERITTGGCELQRVRVEYIFIAPHECDGRAELEPEPEGESMGEIDETWAREVDALLRATQTGVRCLTDSSSLPAKAGGGPLACLNSLYGILVRQRWHIAVMGVTPTKVDWIDATQCPSCGRDLSDHS
jgi:hypothetical protein